MTREPSAYPQMTDAGLLQAAAGGSRAAFAEIVSRHYQPVFRLVWRMTGGAADAEDMAQEAFLRLWRNPSQLRQGAALKGWLMRVAANTVIDRARRPRAAALAEAPDIVDPAARPDAPLDRAQAARRVDHGIAQLPERQRLALSLVYFEGLSNGEAAAVLEVSVEALESLLSRARRGLKDSLSADWRELIGGLAETGH